MKGRFLLLSAVLALSMCLSSCGLIPEEEQMRTAPVIKEFSKRTNKFTTVQRGDISVTERVTCKYVPVKSENLYFALGNERVDKVLVQVGDMVEEGQLLAQLELNGLDEQIAQTKIDLEEAKLRLENLKKCHDLERRRNELEWQNLSASERMQASEVLETGLELEYRAFEDELNITEMRLAALQDELAQRQIRAPFAGTLTYVREYKEGELSQFGIRTMVLSDSTVSLFRADTINWHVFKPGDEYEIEVNDTMHTIVVADEASIGLEPQEKSVGKRAFIYFVLQEADFTLEEGDFAYIDALLQYSEDTLYVPKQAVKKSGDKNLVFYLKEDGLRAYKEVEVGIHNNKNIEILSGLSEGEQIIVD